MSVERNVLRLGDRVQFDGDEHTVVGMTGTAVRLHRIGIGDSVVLLAHLLADPEFCLLDHDRSEAQRLSEYGLLDGLPPKVVEQAAALEAHIIEVETGPWDDRAVEGAINKAAVVRNSEHAGAGLEILSAYPVPREVEFFFGRSPAALLQLALLRVSLDDPEGSASLFREVASRYWGVDLDYEFINMRGIGGMLIGSFIYWFIFGQNNPPFDGHEATWDNATNGVDWWRHVWQVVVAAVAVVVASTLTGRNTTKS
jgi:hypothetical protein